MVGKYHIIVQNSFIKYEFDLYRNITVIRGLSATGKTALINLIREFNEEEDSGISVQSERELIVAYGKYWKKMIESQRESIIFIDEQSRFVISQEFAETVRGSDNYFVIISREKLNELPYSITEVYGIRTKGRYAGLYGEYTQNEFFRLYGDSPFRSFQPDIIITEDSNSAFEFWTKAAQNSRCIGAGGKTKILKTLKENASDGKKCLVVVDGAAFGPQVEDVLQYIKFNYKDALLFAPESFEYLILSSGLFPQKRIRDYCENTQDYADSRLYMSWEQFYTKLLRDETAGTEMQYSKSHLNAYYLSQKSMALILKELPTQLKPHLL